MLTIVVIAVYIFLFCFLCGTPCVYNTNHVIYSIVLLAMYQIILLYVHVLVSCGSDFFGVKYFLVYLKKQFFFGNKLFFFESKII